MDRKYIVIDNKKPVCFDWSIEHKDEAAGRNATSAGFYKVFVENGEIMVECWGESNSLGGLKSKPLIDAVLIRNRLING